MSKDINGNNITKGRYIVYPKQWDEDMQCTTLFKVIKSKSICKHGSTPKLAVVAVRHFGTPSWGACPINIEQSEMTGEPLLIPSSITTPEPDIDAIKLYLKLSNINIGE